MKKKNYEYDNGYDWNLDSTSSNALTNEDIVQKKVKLWVCY